MKLFTQEQIKRLKERQFRNKLRSYKRHLAKQREKYFQVNRALQLIRVSNRIGSQRNNLRWSGGETKKHVIKKLEICMEIKSWGHEFITEAIFNNGTRCDVLDLTEGVIYEILHTETEKEFEQKIKGYPEEFRVVRMRC